MCMNCRLHLVFVMRRLSSASRASPALETLSQSKISPILPKSKPKDPHLASKEQLTTTSIKAPLKGNNTVHLPNSQLISQLNPVSTSNHHVALNEHNRANHRDYISQILSRNDWALLMNHEAKAKRIILGSQFIVSVLQNQENPLFALRFYIWVSNIDPLIAKNQSVKGALANILFRKGPVVMSVEFLKDVTSSGFRVGEDLLLGLAKYCDEIFGWLSFLGITPSTRLHNVVIDALVKSNSLDLAYLKFQQMSADNCKPDRFTYNILIHGFIEREPGLGRLTCDTLLCCLSTNSMAREAGSLLRKLGQRGYMPNSFTFNVTMTCLLRGLDLKETCEILDSFIQKGMKLDFSSYLLLIENLYKAGRGKDVDQYLNQMVKEGFVSRRFDEAKDMLTSMEENGCLPDSFTCNLLLNALVKHHRLEEALSIAKRCREKGITDNAPSGLPKCACIGNKLFGAAEVAARQADATILVMDLDQSVKAELRDRAGRLLLRHQQELVTRILQGACCVPVWSWMSYTTARHSLSQALFHFLFHPRFRCSSHQHQQAINHEKVHLVTGSQKQFDFTVTMTCLLNGLDLKETCEILDSFIRKGMRLDFCSYLLLIQNVYKAGRGMDVDWYLNQMVKEGLAYCESGRFDEAKDMLTSMEENGCFPDCFTCNLLLNALVKHYRLEEALSIAKRCREKGITVNSF
ncbi:hypothetical protein Tsubulata_022393 [Turnera subulata]|uniref:Pentacotripeptide-repeat region of PRORP domain-containing protein n=1 Tax=Turnera subulata TaxID=218843 RepID=A0A9Q0IZL4_9ROSI|nr:hypothetical protein Tsubulata_022393 [Turnera subulata]